MVDLIGDIHGHQRDATRVKWYEPPDGHTLRTYALASEAIRGPSSSICTG